MPDKPAAEFAIDAGLIRALLTAQAADRIPDAAALPLEKVAEGWDSEVWRLGGTLAVRLPRREPAAPLVLTEQRVLPRIAPRLSVAGVRVPAPVITGVPGCGYPWAWSVVPWIDGVPALEIPRRDRAAWAHTLAAALAALHVEAPADHPVNPVRGRALATRAAVFDERLAGLREAGTVDAASAAALRGCWLGALATAPWSRAPVWIHGDLHPGNLVAHDGVLAGIIDFGDVTAGDPAYDLAIAWLGFDGVGRERFVSATGGRYDAATWRRAHGWAAAVALIFLSHSDDDPEYLRLGREAAAEVIASAGD